MNPHRDPLATPQRREYRRSEVPPPRAAGRTPIDRYGWNHPGLAGPLPSHPIRRRPPRPLRTLALAGLLVSALAAGITTATLAAASHDTDTAAAQYIPAAKPAAAITTEQSSATPAAAGTAQNSATGKRICDKYGSTPIDGGKYMVQNDEWGASDGQCVTTSPGGFTVAGGEHHKNDAPAGFPSVTSGCWMGNCTTATTLPTRISQLGPISSSIAGTIPPGTKSNMAYDIWADHSPKKNGHNDALELMIWLNEQGGIKPIGQKTGTALIGGATWDVYKGTNGPNVISYVRQGYVNAANNLPIADFVHNAVAQGSVKDTDYLTNIQAGFEPWQGGPGLKLTNFSVTYPGAGDANDAPAATPAVASSASTAPPAGTTTTRAPAAVASSPNRPRPEPDLWFCPTPDPGTTTQPITPTGEPGATATRPETGPGQEPGSPEYERSPGMGTCTKGTTLPTQISQLGPISSSIAGTIPPGTKSNLAYDIWADSTPKKTGQNNALELMIWLKETGGIKPIGNKTGTVSIAGANWDVYKGANGVNVISYLRQPYVDSADNLPITDFVKDAVKQGSVKDTDYLTNIQAGFEPWIGGPGLQLTKFNVANGAGAAAPAAAPSTSSSSPTSSSSGSSSSGGSSGSTSPSTISSSAAGGGLSASATPSTSSGSSSGSGSGNGGSSSSATPSASCGSGSGSGGSSSSSETSAPETTLSSGSSSSSVSQPSSSGASSSGSASPSSSAAAPAPGGGVQGGASKGGATGALWSLTNGLTGFQSTPWNNEGAKDPVTAPSPNVPGRQAVKFEVPGGGKRSESQPDNSQYKDGDHKFFGYSAYLDQNFATDASDWQVIWQLHDDGANGSPPVALEIGQGKLWLATSGNDHDKDLGPVTPGSDIAVQLEVQIQTGGGFVNVWRDGKQLITNYKPPKGTSVDGGDYLKTGIYRNPSEGKDSTLFLNDLKIGDSLANVGNLAGAPPATAAGGVAGAALPALGVLLAAVPLAVAALRRRRRTAPPALPRPRPAFEPPTRAGEARELERAGR